MRVNEAFAFFARIHRFTSSSFALRTMLAPTHQRFPDEDGADTGPTKPLHVARV